MPVPLPPAVPQPEVQLREFRFLTGCWRAEPHHGEFQEECWSAPLDANMLGTFRQVKEVGTVYEFWTLNIEDGTPTLRLRHFGQWFRNADPRQDELLKLELSALTPGSSATFRTADGAVTLRYTRSAGTLHVTATHAGNGKPEQQELDLTRSF